MAYNSIKLKILGAFNENELTSSEVSGITGLSIASIAKALFRYRQMGLLTVTAGKKVYPKRYKFRLTNRGKERLKFLNIPA